MPFSTSSTKQTSTEQKFIFEYAFMNVMRKCDTLCSWWNQGYLEQGYGNYFWPLTVGGLIHCNNFLKFNQYFFALLPLIHIIDNDI